MSPVSQTAAATLPAAGEPHFLVGQDPQGFWVAFEIHGRAGGLFRSRQDAEHFAAAETGRRPASVTLAGERITLRL